MDFSSPRFHSFGFDAIATILTTVDVDVRLDGLEEREGSCLIKPGDVVDKGEGGHHLAAPVERNVGAVGTFIPFDRAVAIESDNEDIGTLRCFVNDVEVTGVKEVERAVKGGDAFALAAQLTDSLSELLRVDAFAIAKVVDGGIVRRCQ